MESKNKKLGRWQICSAVSIALVAALLASLFVVLYQPALQVEAKEPYLLDVSISGVSKLNVDQPETYTATVNGTYVGELTYSWSITPEDNKTILQPYGATCNLTFTEATEDPYNIEVKVYDDAGNFGVASIAVSDPPTYPDYYVGVSSAPYNYKVKVDGTGWVYAVNGDTGAVDWSSTNASYILNTVCAEGGKIHVNAGNYQNIHLVISNSVWLEGEGQTSILSSTTSIVGAVISISGASNVKVSGLKIDHGYTSTTVDYAYGIQIINSNNVEVFNNYVTDCGGFAITSGIVSEYGFGSSNQPSNNINIHDNIVEHTPKDGIHIIGGDNIMVKNNIVNGTGDDVLYIGGNDETPISNVQASGNVLANAPSWCGIKIMSNNGNLTTPDVMRNFIVKENQIYNVGYGITVGIDSDPESDWMVDYTPGITFASNITISNNQITNTSNYGFLSSGAGGVYADGLILLGNIFSQTGNHGIFANYTINSHYTDNTVNSPSSQGIRLQGGNSNVLSSNVITDCPVNGLYVTSEYNDTVTANIVRDSTEDNVKFEFISDFIFSNNFVSASVNYSGVYFSGCDSISGSSNTVLDNNLYGFHLYQCSRISLSGTIAKNNTNAGILFDYTNKSAISGGIIFGNGAGVQMGYANYNTINGVHIASNPGGSEGRGDGIHMIHNCTYNTITGNVLTDNWWGFIEEDAGDDFNLYTGNIIHGNNYSDNSGVVGSNSKFDTTSNIYG